MSIKDRFATALGDRTQNPNKQLAAEIVVGRDKSAIEEISVLLQAGLSTDLTGDALKVLEMVGEQAPELASDSFEVIIPLLEHRANKIQWRAMSALSNIASFHTDKLFHKLETLLRLMDEGSVVTRDHGVRILITLYQNTKHAEVCADLLVEQITKAPDNQLGQYSEKWMAVIQPTHVLKLISTLENRQPDLHNDSHQKRISRVLKKLRNKL